MTELIQPPGKCLVRKRAAFRGAGFIGNVAAVEYTVMDPLVALSVGLKVAVPVMSKGPAITPLGAVTATTAPPIVAHGPPRVPKPPES